MQRYDTLTTLWHGTAKHLLYQKGVFVHGLNVMLFDQVIRASSMEYEFDISRELWLTPGRFTGLQRDYIDPAALREFLDQCERLTTTRRPSLAQMLCRRKGQRHVSYTWGNCVLGFTFRRIPEPVLAMHSRISHITRMGGCDLALAYCIGREIAARQDENVADYGFTWHISCAQAGCQTGVPYFYSHGHHRTFDRYPEHIINQYPGLRLAYRTHKYFDRREDDKDTMKYGTRRRLVEQRQVFLAGEMKRPAVPLSRLNIDAVLEAE